MPPKIVSYSDEHFAGVKALWDEAFPDPKAWNAAHVVIPAKLAVQRDLFLVAVERDQVVGSAMAGYDGHRGWLYTVAVLEAFRRRGIGSALVCEAESRLVSLGCSKINLQIQPSNAAVADFYKTLGYDVEERISMGKVVGDK